MLKYGICGSLDNPADEVNPLLNLANSRVQEMLLELNTKPCAKDVLLSQWPDCVEDIEKLLRLNVLRQEQGQVYVNFTLFNSEDKGLVFTVSEKHAKTLADKIIAEKSKLYTMLSAYSNSKVTPEKLAFMVIGCYCLDWWALSFFKQRGLQDFAKEQAGGYKYTLWAEKKAAGSLKAVYWGGHSYSAGEYLLHTFGDHESPRYALPDLLFRSPTLDFPGGQVLGSLFFDKKIELGEEIGRVIETIGKTGAPADQIAESAGLPRQRADKILELLAALGYTSCESEMVYLVVPYFDQDDLELLSNVACHMIGLLLQWSEDNITQLEQDLAQINPIKNGVPFREVFIQVWHYIFGLTNKGLAEAGFIHDTYAEASRHKGYLPAIVKGEQLNKVEEILSSRLK